jgi:preprotein translocase subunit SecD
MRQRTFYFLIGIVILAVSSLLVDLAGTAGNFKVFGHGAPVKQGLDLVGGIRLLLTAEDPKNPTSDQMNAAVDVITKRVNGYGVSEPQVSRVGSYSIDVEVPDVKNPDQLRDTLGSTGKMVIYGMGTLPQLAEGAPFTYHTTTFCDVPNAPTPCVVVNGDELDLSQIQVTFDQLNQPQVNFGTKGAGSGVINNIGSIDVANDIAIKLKYGALPVAFRIDASEQVSATLGPTYVHASIVAGIIGLGVVILFMLIYYRLPGSLADLALMIYGLVVFAIFKLIPVTLTLAGIAGFILSIGMAVDANILIFERLKEELRAGKTLGAAIEAGFNRAWTSIRDSNISTMITCAVLYWFGQTFAASVIVGFATTLFIGVAVSMFTAIVVTRSFLRALVSGGVTYNPSWFGAGLENVKPAGRPAEPTLAR